MYLDLPHKHHATSNHAHPESDTMTDTKHYTALGTRHYTRHYTIQGSHAIHGTRITWTKAFLRSKNTSIAG